MTDRANAVVVRSIYGTAAVEWFLIFAIGGPVSSVAFALVRDYNSLRQVGTATGVANAGGHSATALGVLTVGLVLDMFEFMPGGSEYRVAMLALVALLIFGASRTWVWWRRARAEVFAAAQRGEQVPVLLHRHRWDLDVPRREAVAV